MTQAFDRASQKSTMTPTAFWEALGPVGRVGFFPSKSDNGDLYWSYSGEDGETQVERIREPSLADLAYIDAIEGTMSNFKLKKVKAYRASKDLKDSRQASQFMDRERAEAEYRETMGQIQARRLAAVKAAEASASGAMIRFFGFFLNLRDDLNNVDFDSGSRYVGWALNLMSKWPFGGKEAKEAAEALSRELEKINAEARQSQDEALGRKNSWLTERREMARESHGGTAALQDRLARQIRRAQMTYIAARLKQDPALRPDLWAEEGPALLAWQQMMVDGHLLYIGLDKD